jgi:hypothetical protein
MGGDEVRYLLESSVWMMSALREQLLPADIQKIVGDAGERLGFRGNFRRQLANQSVASKLGRKKPTANCNSAIGSGSVGWPVLAMAAQKAFRSFSSSWFNFAMKMSREPAQD